MPKLNRSRAQKESGRGSRPQDQYRSWLERAHYYLVCAYCLDSCDYLEIEHYEPEAYLRSIRRNPHVPSNLFLACHDCNFNKLDYHPKHRSRRRQITAFDKFKVVNAFFDDYERLLAIDRDGSFTPNPKSSSNTQTVLRQNFVLMGYDERHALASRRLNIIAALKALENVIQAVDDLEALRYNDKIRRAAVIVWRNRLLFEAFGVKMTAKAKRFTKAEWLIWCRSKDIAPLETPPNKRKPIRKKK